MAQSSIAFSSTVNAAEPEVSSAMHMGILVNIMLHIWNSKHIIKTVPLGHLIQ